MMIVDIEDNDDIAPSFSGLVAKVDVNTKLCLYINGHGRTCKKITSYEYQSDK